MKQTVIQAAGIVLMSVMASVIYGILHDQVTARVCVEYFTIGHPPVFATENPTLLGIGWGIIATWWVGLALGLPLALVARAGARTKRSVRSLVRPIVVLLAIMGSCALIASVAGWLLARDGVITLGPPLAYQLPDERHVPFLADAWAHSASYLTGTVGGVVLLALVWRSRRPATAIDNPS